MRWLHNFQGIEGQSARWLEQLASFQYKIIHRTGQVRTNADALSRLPAYLSASSVDLLDPGEVSPHMSRKPVLGRVVQCEGEDDLIQAQRNDVEVQQIISLKSGGQEGVSPPVELQKYALVWNQLQVKEGRLVQCLPANSDVSQVMQVVLPKALVPKVLCQLHNSLTWECRNYRLK